MYNLYFDNVFYLYFDNVFTCTLIMCFTCVLLVKYEIRKYWITNKSMILSLFPVI